MQAQLFQQKQMNQLCKKKLHSVNSAAGYALFLAVEFYYKEYHKVHYPKSINAKKPVKVN